MGRVECYYDVAAPPASALLPAAYAITRNDADQILLVRRADDGYWELPGGRVEVGESAAAAVIREVTEEAGVHVTVVGVAGVYSDPAHVLAYPCERRIYQQFAVCFHAFSTARDTRPDGHETTGAGWFSHEEAIQLSPRPAVRQRLTDALIEPGRPHFD
jgi:ADP-ribose pyrophosphatase YjhB (NUDIX family)